MGNISVDYDVLNQKGSPAWYSDVYANIPTPGYKGRMFISTDTYAFYRDNGTGWDLVGGPGTGTITGSGASGQVTYFNGSDTIGGSNDLFWDIANKRLGIGTAIPGAPLDIHTTGTAAQFNGTGVNNSFVLFQNAGSSKWRIGNLYNSGANDYQIFDVTNSTARLTIKNTGASTLIGTFTATSLIKSGGTNLQILLADGSTTPTSTFGAGSVTNVSALTLGTTGTDLTSSVVNSTTTPVITLNVPTASATNRGALSSADWTTFNSKQATITLTTTGTSGAATLVGATLNIPNYTNVGTVTSVAALTLGTTGTDLSSSVANSTSTPVITLNVPTASASNRGALSSADWTTFNSKQATISVTAPVVLTGATISMPAATTSVSGYLTSTDWNTFNNKTSNLGTVTDVVALTIGTTGIDITSTAVTTTTTPVITLNIPTASASNRGALSSTDWNTFNNKQATLSLTTTGTSGAATLVANTLNIPNYGSALSGYLPLTGGTLTGALNLTYATPYIYLNGSTGNQTNLVFNINSVTKGNIVIDSSFFQLTNFTSGGWLFKNSVGSNVLTIADSGVSTFTNTTTFNNYILTDNSILIKTGFNTSTSGYTGIGAVATGLTINLGTGTTGSLLFNTGASYSYTFPAATGTLALTSDLGAYLPLAGGTLTGALNGTSASFSGNSLRVGTAGGNSAMYIGPTGVEAIIAYNNTTGDIDISPRQTFGTFFTKGSVSLLAPNKLYLSTISYLQEVTSGMIRLAPSGYDSFDITNTYMNVWVSASFDSSVAIKNANTAGYNFGVGSSSGNGIMLYNGSTGNSYVFNVLNDTTNGSIVSLYGSDRTTAKIVLKGDGTGVFNSSVTATGYTFTGTGAVIQSNGSVGNAAQYGLFYNSGGVFYFGKDDGSGGSFNVGAYAAVLWNSSPYPIVFATSNAEKMRLKANGELTLKGLSTTANYEAVFYNDNSQLAINATNTTTGKTINFNTSSSFNALSIASTGVSTFVSRGNFLNATDNSLFSVNSGGTLYTVGFSPTATASSTNTLTLTTGQTTYIYTGSGTATWTLPNPSGTNQMFWIKNAGTGIITLNAYSGTNIINNAASSVSSITIAIGATALIQQDGNVKSYQLQ